MHSCFHHLQRCQVYMKDSMRLDLPHLNSIKLGKFALCGLASLKMESDID